LNGREQPLNNMNIAISCEKKKRLSSTRRENQTEADNAHNSGQG